MQNLYITSINKKEGKTFISAGLAATMQSLGYKTCVYKPIQTAGKEVNGFMQSPDLTFVKSIDPYINTHFTYLFKSDYEPLIASEIENKIIDLDLIQTEFQKLSISSDCSIIDGTGGILSPCAASIQNIDIIKRLQTPILYAVTPDKNNISNILASIYTALDKKAEIRGVVINNITSDCDKKDLTSLTRIIEEYSGVNILGLISNIGYKFMPEDLINVILNGIDIESVFNIKIEKLDLD